jgi:putative phosphoribosyl transferase
MKSTIQAQNEIQIPIGKNTLFGNLTIPKGAKGIALFAHGSGSSRFSPRNQYVAQIFNDACIATLLMDLLTQAEEAEDIYTAEYRFDIPLLADRLIAAIDWLQQNSQTAKLHIGIIGSSTGAAAALIAAAKKPDAVTTVVSRGGRPDLAGDALSYVKAPTLLIVGGDDTEVIELNRGAMAQMRCPKQLELVPGATHLFEEPGTLQQAAQLAKNWFQTYL